MEVTKKLLLNNIFFQKINILASDHKTTYIEEVISQKLPKLYLSITNKKQKRSIKVFSRRKKALEKTQRQCSG